MIKFTTLLLPVLVIATVLVSGKACINIQHHLNLPREVTRANDIERHSSFLNDLLGRPVVTDVRLKSEIKGIESVNDIVTLLQSAKTGDTIVFHIAGIGGEVDTVEYLINAIKSTKAETVMIVESPSFSGHAYIALSGDQIELQPYTYLMLHTSSGYGTDCSMATGTDRTVPNTEHCAAGISAHLRLVNRVLEQLPYITKVELADVEAGHDLYLFPEDIAVRKTGTFNREDNKSSKLLGALALPAMNTTKLTIGS